MKKVLLIVIAIVIAAMAGFLPFNGTDIGKLHPVEVIRIATENGSVYIETDSGISGVGENLEEAIYDMKQSASGHVFLETANFVLIDALDSQLLLAIGEYFRPACQIYLYSGDGEMENIGKYLESHPSQVTALSYRQGVEEIPHIIINGEEYRFAG